MLKICSTDVSRETFEPIDRRFVDEFTVEEIYFLLKEKLKFLKIQIYASRITLVR